MPVPHLTAPCAQQAWIDIVPHRYSPHRRTRLMRLSDDSQLLFHAPAPAAFPPVDDLDRAVRHDFRSTLRWTLRPTVSPHPARTRQGGDHRTVTYRPRMRRQNLRSTIGDDLADNDSQPVMVDVASGWVLHVV